MGEEEAGIRTYPSEPLGPKTHRGSATTGCQVAGERSAVGVILVRTAPDHEYRHNSFVDGDTYWLGQKAFRNGEVY
jgi:hypothetical protein